MKTKYEDGELQRTVIVNAENGRVVIKEVSDDETYITVESDRPGMIVWTSARLTATQLWSLAEAIASLFGGVALRPDEYRDELDGLRAKIEDVLSANEARCLDDDVDRRVVVTALVKALAGGSP